MELDKQIQTKKMRSEQNRTEYIDFLRIIACCMVIFNHSNDRGFYRYALCDIHTIDWVWVTFAAAMCKVGVPIFFMISGANLIGKTESYGKTFSRSIRIFFCLLLWSAAYYFIDAKYSPNSFVFLEFIKSFISGPYWHLWYLYAYIAFIFTLPFIRAMAANMHSPELCLMIIIGVLFAVIAPVFENFVIPICGSWKPSWVIQQCVLYPVIGYFLGKFDISNMKMKYIFFICLADFICIFMGVLCEWQYLAVHPGDKKEMLLWITVFVNAIAIFAATKYLFCKWHCSENIRRIIVKVGKLTFGIYLMHIMILWKMPMLLEVWKTIEKLPGGIYVVVVLVFVVSAIITYLMKKLPIVKKFV